MVGRALIGALLTGALFAQPVWGDAPDLGIDPADRPGTPSPMYKASGVTVEEHLGARLPLDTRFRRHDGTSTTLAEVLRPGDELPTILTFNYADCPLLCSMQLNGLTASMPAIGEPKDPADEVALRIGVHYRIITISLEPHETLEKLSRMRARYIERLPANQRAGAERGWTFLAAETPGDEVSIRRVAGVVGFKYTYIPERAEWAHPAAYIFSSTAGVITRYVYGFQVEPALLRDSILKAGLAEPSTAVGFMHTCYFFDPDASDHSREGMLALRLGAAGFLVLVLSGLGVLHLVRKSSRSPVDRLRGWRVRRPNPGIDPPEEMP